MNLVVSIFALRVRILIVCIRLQWRRESRSRWAIANPEKDKEAKKKYAVNNRHRHSVLAIAWQKANPDRVKSYRLKNIEKHRERQRKHSSEYRQKNRIKVLQANKINKARAIENLANYYVRQILAAGSKSLVPKDFPPEIVELKRAQIRLLRAIKSKTQTQK